jgi:hypothetical protein
MIWLSTLSTGDCIGAITAAATTASVVALFLQLRIPLEQTVLQQIAGYTTRYQEIVSGLPEDIREANFQLVGRPDYERIIGHMRDYFDMCCEQWYLNQRELTDAATWSFWRNGIEAALSRSAVQQAWKIIEANAKFPPEFRAFIHCRLGPGNPCSTDLRQD